MKVLVVIPSRLAAARFPNKPLAPLAGRPLLAHVLASTKAALAELKTFGADGEAVVAFEAEDTAIRDIAADQKVKAVAPAGPFRCGSERVAAAYELLGRREDFVINLQGDIPFFPRDVFGRVTELINGGDIATLVEPLVGKGVTDENKVKVAWQTATALADNFSRGPITADDGNYYLHHGVYCFRPSALRRFAALPPTPAELAENLEQLRAVAAGMPIKVGQARGLSSVDSAAQLAQLERRLRRDEG